MSVLSSISKYHNSLSLRLCRVLDDVTASEYMRKLWMKKATESEVLIIAVSQILHNGAITEYVMGSCFEGTTTPGLDSDLDLLKGKENIKVFQSINEIPTTNKTCLLMVKDNHTKPGYVKLQVVVGSVPLTTENGKFVPCIGYRYDSEARVVVCKNEMDYACLEKDEYHGPAAILCKRRGTFAVDSVLAYRCSSWPIFASAWLTRKRLANWPSKELLKELESFGFFLVPVGFSQSDESDKEWRISLSLQERRLMQSLNTTQYKCYVLLKMIKQDILFYWQRSIVNDSVTSYHLKTVLFYVNETSPDIMWNPKNLLVCLQKCLSQLLKNVRSGHCPNYFIPEENMFEGQITGRIQSKLIESIENILSANFSYLLRIRCDGLGNKFKQACIAKDKYLQPSNYRGKQMMMLYHTHMNTLLLCRSALILHCCSPSQSRKYVQEKQQDSEERIPAQTVQMCLVTHLSVANKLNRLKTLAYHTPEETRKSLSLLQSYVELSLMSNIVAEMARNDCNETVDSCLFSRRWNEICQDCDCFSAKLKQATFLHMLGYYKASLEVLKKVKESGSYIMLSVCRCGSGMMYEDLLYGDIFSEIVEKEGISADTFWKSYWTPCIVFLPTEICLTPQPVQYEMFRSACVPQETSKYLDLYRKQFDDTALLSFLTHLNYKKVESEEETWNDKKTVAYHFATGRYIWAAVDGKILLNFLFYLNYKKSGCEEEAVNSLTTIAFYLATDPNLGHIDTCLNILGWSLHKEGFQNAALEVIRFSLLLKPHNNAAIWHLVIILSDMYDHKKCEFKGKCPILLYDPKNALSWRRFWTYFLSKEHWAIRYGTNYIWD